MKEFTSMINPIIKILLPVKFKKMKTRRPNRLPFSQIYTSNNCFFVTVCVEDRVCVFWEKFVGAGSIPPFFESSGNTEVSPTNCFNNLSPLGKIVEEVWFGLPDYFENIILDEFVVMPNHFHGIITFLDVQVRKSNGKNVDLSAIISSFKSYSQKRIRDWVGETSVFPEDSKNGGIEPAPTNFNYHKIWQKSFYDHVIRNEKDLDRIREYIQNNPLKWDLDSLNPENQEVFKSL
jgi:putative transposase